MEIHSSIIAWRIPWTEEPGRLQSMRLQRVRHNLATEQQNISKYAIHTLSIYNHIYVHTYTYIYSHIYVYIHIYIGFPGKESTCNAGDSGLIPMSGQSLGEVTGSHSSIHGLP